MLKHLGGNSKQRLLILEGLIRDSKADTAGDSGRGKPSAREPSLMVANDGKPFMSFSEMRGATRDALHMTPQGIARLFDVITQLASFFVKRRHDQEYRQADLHRQPSLSPLLLPLLGLLEKWCQRVPDSNPNHNPEHNPDLSATIIFVLTELTRAELARSEVPAAGMLQEVGTRLLSWLKLHRSALSNSADLLALTTVGQCAAATWPSLAAVLNDQRFLETCRRFAGARQLTLDETEDFALCVLTPLRTPRGSSTAAQEAAVLEALTRELALTWVFEIAAHAAGSTFDKRPSLLPLLVLCSRLDVQPSAYLTPELVHLFVRQLVRNWRGVKDALLPNFESNQRVLRCHCEEFDRLAGHVHIVETMLCGGRRDTGGNWHPGYLADLRAAVSEGIHTPSTATFMAFCEAEGVALFVSIFEERKRLERFRVRAEREGKLLTSDADVDVTSMVEAVWELVADAFTLRRCANQMCSRAEDLKGTFSKCGRCMNARYCSQKCQKSHWKNGHKQECVGSSNVAVKRSVTSGS